MLPTLLLTTFCLLLNTQPGVALPITSLSQSNIIDKLHSRQFPGLEEVQVGGSTNASPDVAKAIQPLQTPPSQELGSGVGAATPSPVGATPPSPVGATPPSPVGAAPPSPAANPGLIDAAKAGDSAVVASPSTPATEKDGGNKDEGKKEDSEAKGEESDEKEEDDDEDEGDDDDDDEPEVEEKSKVVGSPVQPKQASA